MRELLQLGLGAAQLAVGGGGGRRRRAGRWATGAAGALMIGDAVYSLHAATDKGTGMQVLRVLRGTLGTVFLISAIMGRR